MSDYILEVDEDQLKLISKALDFYARIQTGQISEITNPYMVPLPDADYSNVEKLMCELKTVMFPNLPADAFYSIKSKQIPDEVRQMVDIYEVIRHQLILNKSDEEKTEKEKLSRPFNWSSEKQLPTIYKLEN